MIDNTKGEVKLVRGSGPPILTVDGDVIEIAARVFILRHDHYRRELPLSAEVIGIDLTRRTVRLQIVNGKEYLYSADNSGKSFSGDAWIFTRWQSAKVNCLSEHKKAVADAERRADEAIATLEKAKNDLATASHWTGEEPDNG